MFLSKAYWSGKYRDNLTGWDAGAITTPIKEYIDQIENKGMAILIPGCGYGHEAVYLHDQGFNNVTVIDLADEPIEQLKENCPNWSHSKFVVGDFFDHDETYDLIIEQTFFCALNPAQRPDYAKKVWELLEANGKLVGVLFKIPIPGDGPPFGGSIAEYQGYFKKQFKIIKLEPCYNSIKPRKDSEAFINLLKNLNT